MNARDRGVSTETPAAGDAEGPLRRWARRKRAVAREKKAADEARRRDASRGPAEAARDGRGAAGDASGASEAVIVEEKVLTDEDMPSLDSLDQDSDYSGFLSSGVSEELRRRALRKLFSSAVFNVPDGLDDYDDDFTSFAALGDIVTSDMKHQAEMEAERAEQARARAQPAAEIEDDSRGAEGVEGAEDERLADTGDDVADLAPAGPSGGPEPSEDERLADAGDDATDLAPAEPLGEPESSGPQPPGSADPVEPVAARAAAERAEGATQAQPDAELRSGRDEEPVGAGERMKTDKTDEADYRNT